MRRAVAITAIVAFLAWAAVAPPAEAFRPLLAEAFLKTITEPPDPKPPPEGQLEDPCGLAIGSGVIYVADYYHRVVDLFSSFGEYESQIPLSGGPISGLGINKLDGVCGLAIDSSGDLYANEWHEGVVRLLPTELTLDSGESTGVAVDAAGDVFVDDRTYVAEYAAPVTAGEEPTTLIGEGALSDAYGVAVSSSGERVYVADAASGTVKVFEETMPGLWTAVASLAPSLGFTSLVDSALAIDPTEGHLLVLDNLQPGYEHPEAAIDEFEPDGTFVGQIRGPAGAPIIDGEPSGLAVDAAGDLFVTDGSGELGNAFEFGPDPPGTGEEPASPHAPASDVTIEPAPGPAGAAAAAMGVGGVATAPRVSTPHHHRHRHHRRHPRHRRGANHPAHGQPGSRSAKARRIR